MTKRSKLEQFVHVAIKEMAQPRNQADEIARDFERSGITYCLIGAIALGMHNYQRATDDVDVLVSLDTHHLVHEHLVGLGYIYRPGTKRNLYKINPVKNIEVDVLVEGDNNNGFLLPNPKLIRQKLSGVWYASLPGLIDLKLRSNRVKDQSDVRGLIESNDLSVNDFKSTDPVVMARWFNALIK